MKHRFLTVLLLIVFVLQSYGQKVIFTSFDTEAPKWDETRSGATTDLKYNGDMYIEDVNIYAVVDLGVILTKNGKTYHLDVLSHNLGAKHNWENGDYYAWGETEPYYEEGYAQSTNPVWRKDKDQGYDWHSYKYGTSIIREKKISNELKLLSVSGVTKYCTNDVIWEDNIEWMGEPQNKPDGKYVLDPEDDIATLTFGDGFAIPTQDEWEAIWEQCYWVWTDNYDKTGKSGFIIYKSKSPKDKQKTKGSPDNVTYNIETDIHIFLPRACNRYQLIICGNPYKLEENVTIDFYYWSSSLGSKYACDAVMFMPTRERSTTISRDFVRSTGTPIRAIRRRPF